MRPIAIPVPYRRTGPLPPSVVDGLLALGVAAVAVASLAAGVSHLRLAHAGSGFHMADATAAALLLVGTLSLAWRRRHPLPVLAVSLAASLIHEGLGYAPMPLPFAVLVALYTVGAGCPPAVSASATGGALAAMTVIAMSAPGPLTRDRLVVDLLAMIAAGVVGYRVRLRRARLTLLEEQAVQLEREQAGRTQLAVEQEQARIARELHDIVAHNVSVIVAQAGAAQRVFEAEPEQVRQALGSIEVIGRQALVEMRRLLGVLRTEGAQAELAPQPGLDALPSLLAQTRRAGLPVTFAITGTPQPLPAGIELSAYRIVQEALTNVLKHAGPARATVVLGYHEGFLDLRISDDGTRGTANVVPGQGLVGMHQRAALHGGELAAEPGPDGGFVVRARLPLDSVRP